ncbi:MAG TPA: phosphatase PAP2 family protein [Streptosporangiaceae bacterium]|jgi:membrane-associated phospholipid phosphatase|nr:phosphatase PAP2 family protein [Streptosporangiaceae bacterium]
MTWGRWRLRDVSRPPRSLIAPGARRAVVAVIALCAADVAALGFRYAGHRSAGPFDASADHWFTSHLGLTSPVLTALTWLGDPGPVALITALIALACLWARWWRGAALAVLTVPAATGLTEDVLKPVIDRTIDGLLSLPSGHTTAAFSLATVAAVLLNRIRVGHRRRTSRVLMAVAYALAVAVAVAMVAQGFHYFTDAVAGVGAGTGVPLIGALLIDTVAGRWSGRATEPSPVPDSDTESPGAGVAGR